MRNRGLVDHNHIKMISLQVYSKAKLLYVVVNPHGLYGSCVLYLVLTLPVSLDIATVGRQIPSFTCFLMETLNLEKSQGIYM